MAYKKKFYFSKKGFKEGKALITIPEMNRFFKYVKKTNYCWKWTGYKNHSGYGTISIKNMVLLTHVVSYLIHKGGIPNGLNVLHACDNPECVNPKHLWVGTSQDNVNDRERKGRGVIPHKKGSQTVMAKLTEEDVIEIRECRSRGAKLMELATRFNISYWTIQDIIRRRSWKHV